MLDAAGCTAGCAFCQKHCPLGPAAQVTWVAAVQGQQHTHHCILKRDQQACVAEPQLGAGDSKPQASNAKHGANGFAGWAKKVVDPASVSPPDS